MNSSLERQIPDIAPKFPPNFKIADCGVGEGYPCFVIAEIALAHDGSLGTAHAYIDAVARCRVDAVKFQTHIAEAESTLAEPFRIPFSVQDPDRYTYWKRTAFKASEWRGLAEHAQDRGLIFLSSPFSPEAIDLLEPLVPAWKIAAGEATTVPLIERLAKTRKPMLFSSGLTSWAELDSALLVPSSQGIPAAVFQCTTAYPCPAERIGLNVIAELRLRYGCPVGLSDHSGTIFSALAAVALGAHLIEVHAILSRDCFGPDVTASVTVAELEQLVKGVRFIEAARRNPIDKNTEADRLAGLHSIFGKSAVCARPLPANHLIAEGDLAFKKAGCGMALDRWRDLIGRRLKRDMWQDDVLTESDVE
jgi:N,N'-diacetyllegionaminate synthase